MNASKQQDELKSNSYERHVIKAQSLGLPPLTKKQFEQAQKTHGQLSTMSGPDLEKLVGAIGKRHGLPPGKSNA